MATQGGALSHVQALHHTKLSVIEGTNYILPFVWLARQPSRNLVPVGGGTPHTSGCEPHTPQQTLAAEWLTSTPGEREEGVGERNIFQKILV